MEDAGSKLLVLPTRGNAAAEAAAAELGTPTASLSVASSEGEHSSVTTLPVLMHTKGGARSLSGLSEPSVRATWLVVLARQRISC